MQVRSFSVIFVAACFGTACSMEVANKQEQPTQSTTRLDTLPSEIMGCITRKLAMQVGTRELVNEADMNVAIKYATRLSSVNRALQATINKHKPTHMLINALSHRFKQTPEEIAISLNSPGAYQWHQRHIESSGDRQAYQDIQKICDVVEQMVQTLPRPPFNEYALPPHRARGCPGEAEHQIEERTKEGFFLASDYNRTYLRTPFGQIPLFEWSDDYGMASKLYMQQALLKRLKMKFDHIENPRCLFGVRVTPFALQVLPIDSYYEAVESAGLGDAARLDSLEREGPENRFEVRKRLYKGLVGTELKKIQDKKGKETIIDTFKPSFSSVYQIHAIDDQILPKPIEMPEGEHHSKRVLTRVWQILEAKRMAEKPAQIALEKTWQMLEAECKTLAPHQIKSVVQPLVQRQEKKSAEEKQKAFDYKIEKPQDGLGNRFACYYGDIVPSRQNNNKKQKIVTFQR